MCNEGIDQGLGAEEQPGAGTGLKGPPALGLNGEVADVRNHLKAELLLPNQRWVSEEGENHTRIWGPSVRSRARRGRSGGDQELDLGISGA